MKKLILPLLAVCSLVALFGCNNRPDSDSLHLTQASELKPMQQSYRGLLPCEDCSGIETTLFLDKDGSWVMNMAYQGRTPQISNASYGTWARTADKLVLTDSKGQRSYFRPEGDTLVMMDADGVPLDPKRFTLKPANLPLPATPMVMRGKYFYMADSAVFTDCDTGRKTLVESNAEIERGYLAARGDQSRAVLVVMHGHFAQGANPDTGAAVVQIVVDGSNHTFMPDKDCSDLATQ
ncbi:copper homeostasis/adhesion lipoprotein NlpE [Salmonella enterica subsp. enterica serovar Choleraesuis]|nr:copper homeostasis/adhesion lipoprotein NlpE [Salmonella enterica subsp. enterica serovar Choleraesuis]